MEQLNPRARRDVFGSKINRAHSPVLAIGLPWFTVMLGSLSTLSPLIASAPFLPPFAYLILLGWRLLRPGLLPLWAGLPLGLFDDLYSGQPFGSGILLFSFTLIALNLFELRFPWRGFWHDWGVASLSITGYLAVAALVSGAELTLVQLTVILPQLVLSIALFPIISRIVSLLDHLRLLRIRQLG